ncbi:MAG: hypothetical protein PHE24_05975 [Patescibacteria group bacterium]|nr:hypothetical protein [Patescibacteria group bacterium]
MIGENEKEAKPAMELRLEYSLIDESGQEEKREAQAQITGENLVLRPNFGEPLQLSWREILRISAADYRICFDLISKQKIFIFNLGYQYEDFLRSISKFRNEQLIKDLLMEEAAKKSGIEAEFVYSAKNGQVSNQGKAELRLYETALIAIPDQGDFIRIPYGNFSEVEEEDQQITIATEAEDKLIISRMGERLDPFKKILSEIINELALQAQSFFKELLPDSDALLIRKAAQLMKEGKAANLKALESLSPELYPALEKKMLAFGIKEEYDFLSSMADREKIALGFKRGLMGDLTGDYLWLLIPIYSADTGKPGNAIAMSATTAEGSGKSTYFFRIFPRIAYQKIRDVEELRQEADRLIKTINQAMMEINFRREPIYLSDEKLNEPDYLKYKVAVEKLPALKNLRSLFIGRVTHSSPEQWQKDVNDLLKFNIAETDDDKKWEKVETEAAVE